MRRDIISSRMDILNISTLVFAIFIVLKVIIYHHIKRLQKQTWFMDRLCVVGYHGNVADPFECDSYYKCPEGVKFYCAVGTQFDGDEGLCVPIDKNDVNGCYAVADRRLLN
ncbi:hypothetical protein CaLGV008 [Clostera anastomosis granulovirus A]|uniref:Chitin-binding type-2 domain-containing protein n=1 Tax=Clostera anastomosis granulovirus A TaxID=1986289 RepID=U5KAR3_9BBAC|nr:hypothetical protein CaLGV008 [Clostera anastomosis granulovirus Henan]AGQ20267.1 hypothetical protein CaLGV008 [Clostera anastomosis granulovirus Henan]